jgi:bacterioferritin-associated ferredoxin
VIICSCHGVNDRALDTIVDAGAQTLRQVGDACGAGTDCGACCLDIMKRLKQRSSITLDSPKEERAPLSK